MSRVLVVLHKDSRRVVHTGLKMHTMSYITAMCCNNSAPFPKLTFKVIAVSILTCLLSTLHMFSTTVCSINVYDIRKECTYPPLCYDFSQVSWIAPWLWSVLVRLRHRHTM